MKIMVAYDVEDDNPRILEVAVSYAKAFDAEVDVVSVLPGSERTRNRLEKEAKDALDAVGRTFEKEGIPCTTHYEFTGAFPGEYLAEYVRAQPADQVIIGLRRKSKVGKLMFGSTAQQVILTAPCPVVTVS